MNFLQVARMSLDKVAENIMTCLWWGVARKISWTSRRMSVAGQFSCSRDCERSSSEVVVEIQNRGGENARPNRLRLDGRPQEARLAGDCQPVCLNSHTFAVSDRC